MNLNEFKNMIESIPNGMDITVSDFAIIYRERKELKKDDKVVVWNYQNGARYKRHFSHFENGKIYCFASGGTSWTEVNTIGYNFFQKY